MAVGVFAGIPVGDYDRADDPVSEVARIAKRGPEPVDIERSGSTCSPTTTATRPGSGRGLGARMITGRGGCPEFLLAILAA
jgi:hypothetical protein